MFNIKNWFERDKKTAFVSGLFCKNFDDPNQKKHYFAECATIGNGCDFQTTKDFINSVRAMHRESGYHTRFETVSI